MEDGGELVLDHGHLPLVFHELREDVLGDAAGPLLLQALPPLVQVADRRQEIPAFCRTAPQLGQRLGAPREGMVERLERLAKGSGLARVGR